MKIKTTNPYINTLFSKVYRCGYCDLQDIVTIEPTYYNCGVYGWNYDAYIDYRNDLAITTGYRNMTGKRIPDELIVEYSEKARAIKKQFGYWSNECSEALNRNMYEFFDKVSAC